MFTSLNQIICFSLFLSCLANILHLARTNPILNFCLWQNNKLCFHIFLSVLYFLCKQACGLTYIYVTLANSSQLPPALFLSSQSLSPSLPDCEQRAFGFISCSLTIIPLSAESGPWEESFTIRAFQFFYYFSIHFSPTWYFLFSILTVFMILPLYWKWMSLSK